MLIVAPLGGKVLWLTSVIYGLPPVTAGIGVWLAGVGQAGMYGTAERMHGRTRLYRCWESIPVNNGTRIERVLISILDRERLTHTERWPLSYRLFGRLLRCSSIRLRGKNDATGRFFLVWFRAAD